MLIDHFERQTALNPTQSFIVRAPAGSGKTALLTQRFLKLLSTVTQPEAVIALTFTQKAAAEMRTRIILALQQAEQKCSATHAHEHLTIQLAQQVLVQDKKLHWQILHNPHRLNIKTLDAFNISLNKQFIFHDNCLSTANLVEYPEMLYEEAINLFLAQLEENLPWSTAIATLMSHVDNNLHKLKQLLVTMLAKRSQWLPHILGNNTATLNQLLTTNLNNVIHHTLTKLQQHILAPDRQELIALTQYACLNLSNTNTNSIILNCAGLTSLPGTTLEDVQAWQGLSRLLINQDQSWRKKIDSSIGFPAHNKSAKMRLSALIAKFSANQALKQALHEIHQLPNRNYTAEQSQIIAALQTTLKVLVAQLKVIFHSKGQIDYTENELLALHSLFQHDELALILEHKIQHILVDEFQDTANNQFNLLSKLVTEWQPDDGRSIFLVGDPLQSIYRFRAAEVSLFMRAWQDGLGPVKLLPLTLKVNFRATTVVVDWLNHTFAQVFNHNFSNNPNNISYTMINAAQHDPKDSKVTIHAWHDPREQTQAIVTIIQEQLASKPHHSIGILARARKHLTTIINALNHAGITFNAQEIEHLTEKPLIYDLLALTRALLYPADRIAWLAILRAPWCGLALHDLVILSQQKQELVWASIQNPKVITQLSHEGTEIMTRVAPILKWAMKQRARQPLPLLVQETWTYLGGPACVTNITEFKDVEDFIKQLTNICQQNFSLNNDTIWHNLTIAQQKLYASSNHNSQVSLLTMHNSKGLEFDTVILPDLHKTAPAAHKQLLIWQENCSLSNNLLIAPLPHPADKPNKIWTYLQQQEQLQNKQETARLFYVATTRAKKSLHVMFNVKLSKTHKILPPATNSLLHHLWPTLVLPENFTQQQVHKLEQPLSHKMLTPAQRLASSWHNPTSLPAQQNMQCSVAPTILEQVTHNIFQELALQGVAWWKQYSPQQQKRYIKKLFLAHKVNLDDLRSYLAFTVQAIKRTLQDERGRWILQKHTHSQTQWHITAELDHNHHNFVINRSFIDTYSQHWIIFYQIFETHTQDLLQLNQLAQALTNLAFKNIRFGFYWPFHARWHEPRAKANS